MRWEWYVLIVCIIALILIFWGQGCFSPLFEKKQRLPIQNHYSSDTIYCVYHGDSWGFSQWLQKWGGSIEYIAGKCLCEGDFIYLNPNGYWYWENSFCSMPNYSIMTIKEWEKLPTIANKKIFYKTKEPKMETFKENTYYPVGTKLIYEDKIIEVRLKRDKNYYTISVCQQCVFANAPCYTMLCESGRRKPDYSDVFYAVIGDATPAKHDKAGAEIKTQISFGAFDAIVDMAKKENVFITVEPVKKKDVESRIQDALDKFMNTHCRVQSDITILVNPGTMIKWYAERDYHGSNSIIEFRGFRVKRSPDVGDVEIV